MAMSLLQARLLNAFLYQLIWVLAIVLAFTPALLATLVFLLLHIAWVIPCLLYPAMPLAEGEGRDRQAGWPRGARVPETVFILLVAVSGYSLDSAWFVLGGLNWAGPSAVAPAWLLLIWLAFATTLNGAFAFLQGRWWWAAAAGATAGPLSYASGAALHPGVTLGLSAWHFTLLMALQWALLLPLLFYAAQRWARHWDYGTSLLIRTPEHS